MWRGTVELGGETLLSFRMNLDLSGAEPRGHFLVGEEQTPIPEILRVGDSLTFNFSEYGAEMRGTWNGSQWSGEYIRHRSGGSKSFRFSASPSPAGAEDAAAEASSLKLPVGNYAVHFQDEDRPGQTLAKFWESGRSIHGTFIAPDGDYGLLVGKPAGSRIQMERFTGWQAIVIMLEPAGETWSGQFFAASNDKPRSFVLQPRGDLTTNPKIGPTTTIKNPAAPFSFSGLSVSGETVRSTDNRFKGKALIVDIMGTWCHNCLDAAPVLQKLQDDFGKDRLEVVGLSFEISDDPELGRKNLKLYKDRFGLTYTLLFCGGLDDANVEKRLHSQLHNFFAYPTTLFIRPNGTVKAIHSGFRGPGTGEEFQLQVQEFRELTEQLLSGR